MACIPAGGQLPPPGPPPRARGAGRPWSGFQVPEGPRARAGGSPRGTSPPQGRPSWPPPRPPAPGSPDRDAGIPLGPGSGAGGGLVGPGRRGHTATGSPGCAAWDWPPGEPRRMTVNLSLIRAIRGHRDARVLRPSPPWRNPCGGGNRCRAAPSSSGASLTVISDKYGTIPGGAAPYGVDILGEGGHLTTSPPGPPTHPRPEHAPPGPGPSPPLGCYIPGHSPGRVSMDVDISMNGSGLGGEGLVPTG